MEKSYNILVIGNGFDLAHGLPTTYNDFLEFAERVIHIFEFPASKSELDYQHVRRHIVRGANRTLISVETPLRSCRIGTCRRLSAG